MLKAGGASAGSSHYWQQKLNTMYFRRAKMLFDMSDGPPRLSICTDSSVHGCRDTMLSIFFDHKHSTACYGVSQQLWPGKSVAANDDLAIETEELERVLARREQSRLSTYKLAQGLSHQLLLQTDFPLSHFQLPEHIRPLLKPGNGSDRVVTENRCVKIAAGEEVDVIQASKDASTDMSLASFLHETMFMVHMDYDVFHRLARDQKLASEHCGLGQSQMASQYIWSVNFKPYGSGAWFSEKQEAMSAFFNGEHLESARCHRFIDRIASEFGMPCRTFEEQQQVWSALKDLRSFCFKGACPKPSRWNAWIEAAEDGMRERWGARIILEYYLDGLSDPDDPLLGRFKDLRANNVSGLPLACLSLSQRNWEQCKLLQIFGKPCWSWFKEQPMGGV